VNNESYGLSDGSVFQDGQIPVPSTTGLPGWAYSNATVDAAPKDKINWYFFDAQRQSTPTTLGDLTGVYALVQVNDIQDPIFLQVYTKPQGPGAVPPDAGSFFRSRITYIQPAVPLTPGIYLFHSDGYNVDGIFPEYPRVVCSVDPGSTVGPQDPTEELLLANIATSSGAAPGTIDIVVRQTGIETANLGRSNFGLEVDDLSPRLIRGFDDGLLPAEIAAFETVIFTNSPTGAPSVTTSLGSPGSYAEQKALYFINGNPNQDVVIDVPGGVQAAGPDGQFVTSPASLTYPAGSIPAGTQITWRGAPADASAGIGPRWYLSGTNYDTTGGAPVTPSWPQTLAVGEKTEGVMPALQERAGFDPSTHARDQLHTYWAAAGQPEATVGVAGNQTASYIVPIFREVVVSGGGTTTDVAVLAEPGGAGGYEALVSVQVIARQVVGGGAAPLADANLRYITTVWISGGTVEVLGTQAGDVANFEVLISGGSVVLRFTDATTGASNNATIHGMATVQPVGLLIPS